MTSTWVGFIFNLVAVASLWLSRKTFKRSKKAEEEAEDLNRKAQLLYRGPVLVERIRAGRQDLNQLTQATTPDLTEIASQNGVLVELVQNLDEKLDPDGTEQGTAIIEAAENRTTRGNVLQHGRQLYSRLARFAVHAEERIEDQKQSLL